MSKELRNHVSTKQRTLGDLLEFVRTRTDGVPNYTLLLGAGASVTSGIRPASELVSVWRQELYQRLCESPTAPYSAEAAREFLARHHAQWYSPQREYSSLFEKKFDLPRQRRMFVENEVSGKLPSLGYAYLIRLVQNNFFSTIFTTNFDDLLNEAFHQFSDLRPIVCAHDSSISSITVTSKRPKVIKLHGDYLFDDIKSTVRETESLEENTKRKFTEFAKDHGLIVVGYSGHDRSVMDVLQHLLKQEDYFKHGIYWCVRPNDAPSEELTKLLWRERAYWVEVEGYDELLARMYRHCIGTDLPVNTLIVTEKPREVISRFCEDARLQQTTCAVIKEDIARLRRELEREDFIESMRSITESDNERNWDPEGLSDREIIQLLALRKEMETQNIAAAMDRIHSHLGQSSNAAFREQLLRIRLSIERSQGNVEAALQTCDALIDQDPKNVGHLMRRFHNEPSLDTRLALISRAIEIDPYDTSVLTARAKLLKRQLDEDPTADVEAVMGSISNDYARAIELQPGITNPAWTGYFHFLVSAAISKNEKRASLDGLLARVKAMDAYSPIYLGMKVEYVKRMDDTPTARTAVVAEIREAMKGQSRLRTRRTKMLLLRTLKKFDLMSELLSELVSCDADEAWRADIGYIEFRASVFAEKEGKLFEAIRTLESHKACKKEVSTIKLLLQYLCFADKRMEANAIFAESKRTLDADDVQEVEDMLLSEAGDYVGVLASIRRQKQRAMFPGELVVSETHELLKLCRYEEAERVARELLNTVHFARFFELIVNYEIARIRQGGKADKTRLARVLEGSDNELTCACAALLMDDKAKAAERLLKAVQADRTNVYRVRRWAIFDATPHKNWLSTVLRGRGYESELDGVEVKRAG